MQKEEEEGINKNGNNNPKNPDEDEKLLCNPVETERKDEKTLGVQEIAWALLTSAEFRFSY